MAGATAITDQVLKRISPPEGSRLELWDQYVEGFGYRATQKGKGSFFIMFWLGGRRRRVTLGRYPVMSLKDARAAAEEMLTKVGVGVDPVEDRENKVKAEKARHEEEQRERNYTIAIAADEFLAARKYRASTRAEVERLFKREVLPMLGARPVASVTRKDIAGVVNAVSDRGATTTANRLFAYLHGFFAWLVRRGMLDASPVEGMEKPSEDRERDRVLSDPELSAIYEAAGKMGYPFGSIVRLLILTVQRREEVAGMRRQDLDLDGSLWRLPRELTKSDRAHEVPLSAAAKTEIELAIGHQDKRNSGDLVFAATRRRKLEDPTPRHISGWSAYKRTLDAAVIKILTNRAEKLARQKGVAVRPVTLAPWVLHDLRRTAASGMAKLGIAPHVVERVLNHATGSIRGVAAIYNRHKYEPEMAHAVKVWEQHVIGLTEPPSTNVVLLRA